MIVGESGDPVADRVFPGTTLDIGLNLERQVVDELGEGIGQHVVRVQVADRIEGLDQFCMELPDRQVGRALAQQAEALHRTDRVHGFLQRQMDIEKLEQRDRLIDDPNALGWV